MKSYLIKNKKYTFMIIFFICFFFCIGKVDALVIKTNHYFNDIKDTRFTGSYNSGTEKWVDLTFTNPIDVSSYNYDYMFFRVRELNFANSTASLIDSDTNTRCTYWANDIQGNNSNYRCNTTASDTLQDYQFKPFETTVSAFISDTNGFGLTCFFTSDLEDHIMCPLKNAPNIDFHHIKGITFIFNTLTDGGQGSSITYAFRIDKQVFFGNGDSTEVVNALSNLGTIQQQTTTTIQNFNNYVANTDTTTSVANSNTELGGLNTEFSSHLSQMNELTQLTMLPLTFISSLLTSTCQPLVWDIPFVNSRVVVPCMSTIYNGYFSVFIGIFSTIMTALLGYRAFVKLFNAIKSVVDAEDDKLEVVDL